MQSSVVNQATLDADNAESRSSESSAVEFDFAKHGQLEEQTELLNVNKSNSTERD